MDLMEIASLLVGVVIGNVIAQVSALILFARKEVV